MRMYLVGVLFLLGFLLKAIDDGFDEERLSKRIAIGLAVFDGVLAAIVMLDSEGFVIFGAVFWTSIIRKKVDNMGFYSGFATAATLWMPLYLAGMPFTMSWMVVVTFLWNVGAVFVISNVHDMFKGKKNLLNLIFIENRNLHLPLVLPLVMVGLLSPVGFIGLFTFVQGYASMKYLNKYSDRIYKVEAIRRDDAV